jgi:arginyl-tRNA synthetase
MNVCQYFCDFLIQTLDLGLIDPRVIFEPTKDKAHGDLATNAAMILAKLYQKSPKDLAQTFSDILKEHDDIEDVFVAGSGFVNLKLKKEFWQRQLSFILKQGVSYGDGIHNETVNIEFVSANPTGPLHTGHARNAVLGDVLAALLEKAGYNVTREYYINDAGGQIQSLTKSLLNRYKEALGLPMEGFDSDMYAGDYLIPVAKRLKEEQGDALLERLDIMHFLQNYVVTAMMNAIEDDLQKLGVVMDIYTSEKEIMGRNLFNETLGALKAGDNIYTGTLAPPKGHDAKDWCERSQTLFKSTLYGDDVDRALKKSDDSWTYFAGDLAYHYDKIKRGYDILINVFGADHIGYIKRLKAGVKALGQAQFEIKTTQLVNFLENGKPFKMSKRAGTFVTLLDVVEKVGKDAARYMMISRHQDVGIDFDFVKIIEKTHENPVFYIQYAHARICSVQRHALEVFGQIPEEADLSLLDNENELSMIKMMTDWPRQIEVASRSREPHRIAQYVHGLSTEFHKLWSQGRHDLRFIDPKNVALTHARLALLKGVQIVLQSGLNVLGMSAVEEM